jgi:hypothetical protein
MKKLIEEIEGLEEFEELDIFERLQVLQGLLKNTINYIDWWMIDTEEDKKAIKDLQQLYKNFNKIIKGA